ncbi:SH2 domain-containing protein 5 isoform X1 [Lepisosteus oculatus]|uniref:SH2 domain-containing protein 5 isoform X1 n=2 Tax=Lepisosteus oculatus TaxID=7918 RepID=UPI0037189B51
MLLLSLLFLLGLQHREGLGFSLPGKGREQQIENRADHTGGMCETPTREASIVTRSAEYVGSFPVEDCCLDEQTKLVHEQLQSLKDCNRRRPVSLKFSLSGLKMYDEDENVLLMAHALRRVSFSTCSPSEAQFAFVSHNPGCPDSQLYCHLFKGRHARAARFLNLLLCRCFQLVYLQKHPEEVEELSVSPIPDRPPMLLNQGISLNVSALVSFRRAPTQGGLVPSEKEPTPDEEQQSSPEENQVSSPTLVRKKAIRNKVLRSGAYRSFTYSSHTPRPSQDRRQVPQGRAWRSLDIQGSSTPTLAETEEALAEAVWSWAGLSSKGSSSLLLDDVLGAFLLHPQSGSSGCSLLTVRTHSGLANYNVKVNAEGKYFLENHLKDFDTIGALIEHYTEFQGELGCSLSSARVNHCYEWEEGPRGFKHSARPNETISISLS